MLNCEYLVYSIDQSSIATTILDKAYEIFTMLPYPMRENPLNAIAIKSLSQEELSLLKSNELALIRKKIKTIDLKLEVTIFPKSLQQFYIATAGDDYHGKQFSLSAAHAKFRSDINDIKFSLFPKVMPVVEEIFNHNEDNVDDEDQLEFDGDFSDMNAYHASNKTSYADHYSYALYRALHGRTKNFGGIIPADICNTSYSDFMQYLSSRAIGHGTFFCSEKEELDEKQKEKFYQQCHDANNSNVAKKIWRALNTALVSELRNEQALHANATSYIRLTKEWINKYKSYCKEHVQQTDEEELEDEEIIYQEDKIQQLYNVLCFEIKHIFAPKTQHLYIVYRGSSMGPVTDKDYIHNNPGSQLSYSNGVCNGAITDKNACAWIYFGRDKSNKKEDGIDASYDYPSTNVGYALLFNPNNKEGDAFSVPPIIGFLGVYGYGEYFHVRHNPKASEIVEELLTNSTFILKYQPTIPERHENEATKNMLMQYIIRYSNTEIRKNILADDNNQLPDIKEVRSKNRSRL